MIKLSSILVNTKLALAPMAGVTDLAFRTICREFGAQLTCTEMISSKALVYQDKKTLGLLKTGENEHPVAVQIFGSDAGCMADAAAKALEISGADIIDINMGCPVGKVVKSGDGCALMKDPDKAMKIIEAVVKSARKPVTIKIRKGWDKGHINAVAFSKMAEAAGAQAIAVHGRTAKQMYSGKADWDIIRDVKSAVNIPVLANGDIYFAKDVIKILNYTGADIAMIARGAMGDPWLFEQALTLLDGKSEEQLTEKPNLDELVKTAMRQFEITMSYKGERIACLEARKHYNWYLRGVPNSSYFKEQISKAASMDDLRKISNDILINCV